MAKDGRRHQDMSIEEILKSIRGIIDNRTDIPQTNEDDILELTDAVDDRTDINNELSIRFTHIINDLAKNKKNWLEGNIQQLIHKYLQNII